MATTIEIDNLITVGTLAEHLSIPVTKLITELMKNGVMATVNERIDFDTAQIIVTELDLDIELVRKQANDEKATRVKPAVSDKAKIRPPVVAVMGHVDHGKTSLLDAIRGAQVAKGEAGGITQHISAYQVERKGRAITFLDTPGHEAFAALREHGARLTDVVIIVVAADDGIKPQTVEAIRFARKAGVKIIVALNKMDKEAANPGLVKGQLAENGVVPDDKIWGGDVPTVEVSAKTGKNIEELLDTVLLVADLEELRADDDVPAQGLIIEAHMEKGRGSVAEALVEAGTLKPGQFIVAGSSYARLRNLESTLGKPLKEAGPSTPVVMTGFKSLPEFADTFMVVADEKTARSLAEESSDKQRQGGKVDINSAELMRMINRSHDINELNVIIKADVQGSLTSVIDSLKSIDTDEVAIRVVGSGVGTISENDIHLAATSSAILYGFNVPMPTNIKQLAARDKVSIRLYKVIYELLDDAKLELQELLPPEVVETEIGRLVVKAIFKTTKTEIICGGEVTKGKIIPAALARVIRAKEVIAEVEVTGVKRGPQEAKEVFEGDMCGISLATKGRLLLQEGDHVEVFSRQVVARTLL
ncbi:MAG: translation initiation factor IF-2 [Candidatus Saccharimonadales bacterium]